MCRPGSTSGRILLKSLNTCAGQWSPQIARLLPTWSRSLLRIQFVAAAFQFEQVLWKRDPPLTYWVWLRIIDESLVPEMRIRSMLFIKSDLKWCIHLSRSPCCISTTWWVSDMHKAEKRAKHKTHCPLDDRWVMLTTSKAFYYFRARRDEIRNAFDPPKFVDYITVEDRCEYFWSYLKILRI